MSSEPNDAGLAGYMSGGDLSTTDTLPSAAHAQPHSQLPSVLVEGVNVNRLSQSTGCADVLETTMRPSSARLAGDGFMRVRCEAQQRDKRGRRGR